MDEEIEVYLDDLDEEDDLLRNRRRPRRYTSRSRRRRPQSIVVRPRPTAPVRYAEPPEPTAPVVSKLTGKLRTGVLIEAATQVLAALQPLPPQPPSATASVEDNYKNLTEYQVALANTAKRNEQIRTIGRLAHIFMK